MYKRNKFSRADVKILSEKTVFKGFFEMREYRLSHRLFRGGWGEPITRELFVRGLAVGVLLYDPDHDLVGLVEQFRIGALDNAAGPWLLEVVAGVVEAGETPEDVALRELEEEAGISGAELLPVCDFLVSPGGESERIKLYCGLTSLEGKGGIFGLDEEGEDIRFQVMSRQDAMQAMADGYCNNSQIVICLQWLMLNVSKLRAGAASAPD